MGGGNPIKKITKEIKRVAKDPVKALAGASTMGVGTAAVGGAERAATGGVGAEILSGGMIESKQTQALKSAQSAAEAEQAGIVKKQADEANRKAKARELRRSQQALGKRSLLWQGQGGSELGVQKKTTLG